MNHSRQPDTITPAHHHTGEDLNPMPTSPAVILLAIVFLVGCGGGGAATTDDASTKQGDSVAIDGHSASRDGHANPSADAADTSPTDPVPCGLGLGAPCFVDEQCASGLCFISEYAPFGMCTVRCEEAPGFCITEDGEQYADGWCVKFPDGEFKKFNHPDIIRFCVPSCNTIDDCRNIHPGYETCGDILYKGDPLFPTDPKRVCQVPSAIGKTPVDPFTCEKWELANSGNGNEKNLCKNYCKYLDTCQYYYPPGHNMDCCAWYCYLNLVNDNGINELYKDKLTNFTNWFKANQGNSQQCEGEKQFGLPPLPDANAPEPVEGKCQ